MTTPSDPDGTEPFARQGDEPMVVYVREPKHWGRRLLIFIGVIGILVAAVFGLKAVDLVDSKQFGRMAALHGDAIVDVSLEEATRELKTVPPDWYDVAKAFFG